MVDIKSNVTNVESDSAKAQKPCRLVTKKMTKKQRESLLNVGTHGKGESMEESRLTPEIICAGLRMIQAGYERQGEDFDIVFAERENGKGQHRLEVSFCRLLSEAVELLKEQKKQLDFYKKHEHEVCTNCPLDEGNAVKPKQETKATALFDRIKVAYHHFCAEYDRTPEKIYMTPALYEKLKAESEKQGFRELPFPHIPRLYGAKIELFDAPGEIAFFGTLAVGENA